MEHRDNSYTAKLCDKFSIVPDKVLDDKSFSVLITWRPDQQVTMLIGICADTSTSYHVDVYLTLFEMAKLANKLPCL